MIGNKVAALLVIIFLFWAVSLYAPPNAAVQAAIANGAATIATGDMTGAAAAGRDVYMGTCIMCHGPDAKGMPGMGKDLVDQSAWMKQQTDATLAAFIKQGRPTTDPANTTGVEMPPKGGNTSITDQDIANLVAYLRELQKSGK